MIKQIKGVSYVLLICHKIEQPIGNLYVTTIPWQIIRKIAYVNPRILAEILPNGEEEYIGIQRGISEERKKEIAAYVNQDANATFPTSIILNIPFNQLNIVPVRPVYHIEQDKADDFFFSSNLHSLGSEIVPEANNTFLFAFPYIENVAQIIDGQHRMSGFEKSLDTLDFEMPVTIFVEQIIENQAEIFATINGKQTRVTPSLVYDLFGISLRRSPYKVVHELIKFLNESASSPLKNWVKILGKSNSYYSGYVTQSTLAKNIIPLICGNIKQAEEDKRNLAVGKRLTDAPTKSNKMPVLRSYFVKEEDGVLFKIFVNFFSAVKNQFPLEWEKENSILRKTVGITALFKVFEKLAIIGKANNTLTESFFTEKLSHSKHVVFENIQLSSKGVNQLVERFD